MDDALADILARTWSELARGASDRRHAFHVPTLATSALDGAPVARSVVLRAVDGTFGVLRCHTDARSAKAAELARDPRVAWHFYASDLQVQVRARGMAAVHRTGPIADGAWAASALSSRRCYLAPRAPGAVSDVASPNLPESLRGRRPTEEETVAGRVNFAVVETRVDLLDWLWLASDGHRRARFARGADGRWSGCWLEP